MTSLVSSPSLARNFSLMSRYLTWPASSSLAMASLISLIERSISASSSSSGGSAPSALAWIVDAKTASPSDCVEIALVRSPSSVPSHSTASSETLSHFAPPLRSAC